jgi:hypothetical protein
MTARAGSLALAVAGLALTAASCRDHAALKYECLADAQCPAGEGCSGGACLPFGKLPSHWGLELEPLSSDATGLTEKVPLATSNATSPASLDLVTSDKVPVAGQVSFDVNAEPLSRGHVLLSIPPLIAGRPDLVYETSLVPGAAFSLALPAGVMGRTGSLRVLPLASDARTRAPGLVPMVVAPAPSVAMSSKSFAVRGRLLTAFMEPKPGMIVRAFQSGDAGFELVSNAATTGDDGTFTLVVPTARLTGPAAQTLTVEVMPPPDDAGDPRLTTKPFTVTGNVDLGDLALPAFAQPNVFRLAIHGDTPDRPPVGRSLVYARTQLADDASGVTDFVRQGVTDGTGSADLSLVPGLTMALRKFDLIVVPPPDSPFGIKCVPILLGAGGTRTAPVTPPAIPVGRRTAVRGTVLDAGGSPVEGVAVRPTRTELDRSIVCAASVTVPLPTITTDARGHFDLFLDPGAYQFDYDPPAGSASPRYTDPSVVVPASAATTQIGLEQRLPAGNLIDGTASDLLGRPLPYAAVRVFEILCTTTPDTCSGPARVPPALRAQGRADASGRFRLVFPADRASPTGL